MFAVTSMTGCGTAIDPADAVEHEKAGTSSQSLDCVGQCDSQISQCEAYCTENFDPYWDEAYYRSCMSNCFFEYQSCRQYTYVLEAPSYQICHIDPDTHISGIDVELHTVDVYVDPTCANSTRFYRKRALDSVHCGFHTESTCKQRVMDRIMGTWIPQGYYPTVTEADGDADRCPGPRL